MSHMLEVYDPSEYKKNGRLLYTSVGVMGGYVRIFFGLSVYVRTIRGDTLKTRFSRQATAISQSGRVALSWLA